MKFCSNCGATLEPNERFCAKCGTPVAAAASAAPVAVTPVAAAPVPVPQPFAAPPVAPIPTAYPPLVATPVAMPPQAPAQSGGKMWTWIIVAVLAVGGYYYYTHQPAAAPATPPAATPGTPAAPGTPGASAPATPPAQGADAALTKQQNFAAHWQSVGGFIQISNGVWTNNATVAVQSSTLECDQVDANGNDLDEMRTTLNGPVQPGGNVTFNAFNMGAVAANMSKVNCTITHVKQPGAAQ